MVDSTVGITRSNFLPDDASGQEIDAEIYNGIARCAELVGIQLIESNFNVSPSFFEQGDEWKMGLNVADLHQSFDQESRISTCIFEFEVTKKKGRKKSFMMKDHFIVFYHIATECDEFHATSFAKRTGVMACYPYFRAHVAQTAALANADIPIMPTLAKMPVRGKSKKKDAKK